MLTASGLNSLRFIKTCVSPSLHSEIARNLSKLRSMETSMKSKTT